MRRLGWAAAAVCALSAACGKKGPPLAPLVPIPAPVQTIDAERVGRDVFVSLTIPAANVDEFAPADLGRVEIYAYTGRAAPPRARWFELGTVVATVPVAPPPPPPGRAPDPDDPATPPNAPPQGATVTIRDTLTPDELVQGREAPAVRDPRSAPRTPESGQSIVGRDRRLRDVPLTRFYTALPWNTRGRPGPPGAVAELPLLPAPDPPPSIDVRYTERATLLSWEPSGGLLGFLLDRALPDELPPVLFDDELDAPVPDVPAGPPQYYIYREILPDPFAPPPGDEARWQEEPPTPVNAVPVQGLGFTDSVELGRRRCYTVRTVRGIGAGARIGDASPPACVTPLDTFAPAPPTSLAAVASEGAISLIWEPNTELDLGGYVVLRGEAPGGTLQPLTAAPIRDARHRDELVSPGVRYVYAVVAVDNRFPIPNMSPESNRVEETAR